MYSSRQRLLLVACSTSLTFFAARAESEPQRANAKSTCPAAYKDALDLEQAARLRQAKDLLLVCAKPECGRFLEQQCIRKYLQLDEDIPSVVLLATDDTGMPRVDVRVNMDGEFLASRLDGVSLPVNPGVHEFSFSSEGRVFATQRVLVVQGQRNRPIMVSLSTPDRFGLAPSLPPPGEIEAKTAALGMRASITRREDALKIDAPPTDDKPVAKESSIDREPPTKKTAQTSLPAGEVVEAPSLEERCGIL